jgi:hypothetical protein
MFHLPNWVGQTIAVVGSGPSAADIVPRIRDRFPAIVVNRTFEIWPDADILYAADIGFWSYVKHARNFARLKLCCDQRVHRVCPSVELVTIPYDRAGRRVTEMQAGPLGTIGSGGGNSGFQAVNIAAQCGPARILLVGIDYCGEHWHGPHGQPLRNPSSQQFAAWRDALDAEAPRLERWGIEVINLSPISALKGFRRENCDMFDQTAAAISA